MIEATSYENKSINISAACVRLWTKSDFIKNPNIFFLKLGRLGGQVIVAGREFQILGPW